MIKITPHTSAALANSQLRRNLKSTLGKAMHSRDIAVAEVANWEELRRHAHDVKAHTLSRLDFYLENLEKQIETRGGTVYWAEDGAEAVRYVLDVARRHSVRKVVKSKSMLTEEIHLNEALEQAGIRPVETDLGEFLVQLAGVPPSHIVAPALHMSRREIIDLMVEKTGMEQTEDVEKITFAARRLLRQDFLSAGLGVTGVNFGVAETGTLVIVENEGNARLTMAVPEIHIALMGIEKVIPRTSDLAVFLKLLTRSATGQRITSYVNFISGPRRPEEPDGPAEFHLVLVDNGRSRILQDPFLRQTLACIRCGACLSVCPVYQSIGGHAYASTYQGPIGAILTPQLLDPGRAPEHPFASSLCGACYDVCPVKIEIPHILLKLREQTQRQHPTGAAHRMERIGMRLWAWVFSSPRRFRLLGRLARLAQKSFSRKGRLSLPFPPFNRWTQTRDLPVLPSRSFRELYKKGDFR